jgi:hypothetical protein
MSKYPFYLCARAFLFLYVQHQLCIRPAHILVYTTVRTGPCMKARVSSHVCMCTSTWVTLQVPGLYVYFHQLVCIHASCPCAGLCTSSPAVSLSKRMPVCMHGHRACICACARMNLYLSVHAWLYQRDHLSILWMCLLVCMHIYLGEQSVQLQVTKEAAPLVQMFLSTQNESQVGKRKSCNMGSVLLNFKHSNITNFPLSLNMGLEGGHSIHTITKFLSTSVLWTSKVKMNIQ